MDPLVLLLGIGLFTLFGCLAGIVTGLVPGIHVNNLALITLTASASVSAFAASLFGWASISTAETVFMISAFIIGATITHSYLDYVPSVYLGAPNEENALSVLPGHRLLLQGRGYEAIKCAALGSFGGAIVSLALVMPVRFFMGSPINAYEKLGPFIPHILIIIVALLVLSEGEKGGGKRGFYSKKLYALLVFLLSGFFGLVVLGAGGIFSSSWVPLRTGSSSLMLFPLFTGMFGLSTLATSLRDKAVMPPQKVDDGPIDLENWRKARGILSGSIAGALVGWFPGVSSGAATPVAKAFSGGEENDEKDAKEYITAVASVGTSCSIFVVVALFIIFKARSGAMVAVLELGGPHLTPWEPIGAVPVFLCLMLFSVLLSSVVSTYLTLYFGALFARIFARLSYARICAGIIVFLVILIFLMTGPMGLLLAGISTCIGLIPPLLGTARVHLMGCLIFPIILYYFGLGQALLAFLGVV